MEFSAQIGVQEMLEDESIRFVVSVIDKSIEKSLQAQRQQAQKMETIGHLVGGIAHYFNNILTIIIGNIDLASQKLNIKEHEERHLTTALAATYRASDLTRKLLIFSRHDVLDSATDNLNAAITEIKDLIQSSVTPAIDV